ncbi:MAG: RelA/SpoT family protein [Prevotella sp.]|nr:RelA/SpoT family protein [Prevotella sp.]
MEENFTFTTSEIETINLLRAQLREKISSSLLPDDERKLERYILRNIEGNRIRRDVFGFNPIVMGLKTALIAVDEIGLRRDGVFAILLYTDVINENTTIEKIKEEYGNGVAAIVKGLVRLHELYKKTPVIETENFRNLIVSFAEDMRVILVMIADRVNMMRELRDTENISERNRVAEEASYLYAPLAHKLGLYKLKSELEDLSLKYLEHDAYYMIREKLSETKQARDKYIADFIGPISKKLEDAGLKFHIKGRTKSIHSIWQKMKKQKCAFEGVYDLFAIRIILDSELPREKVECWHVYSIITDMYQPNPKRLRDWLSVPKSNGYESLHITVLGPENKWVEVQIRTERMDDIAERGLAAHWRYKGVKGGGGGLDEWLTSIRQALEAGDDLQVMDQFKMDLYEKEVYVFSPKGDILKFPKGATVLDFAYHIHSNIGNRCTGAKINGKNVTLRHVLSSGDTVEIVTNSKQIPKQEWLTIVKTSRGKAKIRQALRELQMKDSIYAKELLERKFRNKKVEMEDSVMMRLVKRMGYKETADFYRAIVDETLDVNTVIERYIEMRDYLDNPSSFTANTRSAEEFQFDPQNDNSNSGRDDTLVIDQGMKGIDYTLARCCQPIYGDPIFGFVTVNGGIKIHHENCPNANDLRRRFGYRIVKARWSGKGHTQYAVTLRVVGNDDIGIVNNLTSVISKDEKLLLRNITIDSHDGLFSGTLTVQIDDTNRLESLMKKLRVIKGVRAVTRI